MNLRFPPIDPFSILEKARDLYEQSPLSRPCLMPVTPMPGGPCAVPIAPPAQWTTADFVTHYYLRSGATVDLDDVGLLDDFQNSESGRKIQTLWEATVVDKVKPTVTELLTQGGDQAHMVTLTFEEGFTYDVAKNKADVTNPLYSVAGGYLVASATCTVTYDPATKTVRWNAELNYKAADAFKDPANLGIELGGKPYAITIEWNARLSG